MRTGPVILCLLVGAAASSAAGQATLIGLGQLPSGAGSAAAAISADGNVVVGMADAPGGVVAFRWTSGGGMVSLGTLPGQTTSEATAVNADGSVVVGNAFDQAFRWTSSDGMHRIAGPTGSERLQARGVSADGAVVVGEQWLGSSAYRWEATGPTSGTYAELPMPPRFTQRAAMAVSADGSSIAGLGRQSSVLHALRWTGGSKMIVEALEAPPTGASFLIGWAISGDGRTVAGSGWVPGGNRPVLWTSTGAGGHSQQLGLTPGADSGLAVALSASGGAAAGYSISAHLERATYWTAATGTVDLNTYLPSLGVNLDGWLLRRATGLSADGLSIVGWGSRGSLSEAWLVRLPGPPPPSTCYANCDGSTAAPVLNVSDFVCFMNRFSAGDPYANCDGSTAPPVLNVNDFVCFQAGFAAGCP